MSALLNQLKCPKCSGELSSDPVEEVLVCRNCGAQYQQENGVVILNPDESYYWGELEREQIAALLAEKGNIDDVIGKTLNGMNNDLADYLRHYAGDESRAAWRLFAPMNDKGAFLDIGCGWGAISLALASQFESGWVLDLAPERVELVVRRARSRNRNKILGCASRAWPVLPFADGIFDLVVLNGVLEWIPDSVRGVSPQKVQQDLLCEVARILKPDGQLYIGIENRYGYRYFLGKQEEHTKMRFISLLPRFAGRLYHALLKGKEYRTFTYGYFELSRMLKRAGLISQQWLCPYPDYREFDRLVDLDSRTNIECSFPSRRLAARVMKQMASIFDLWRYLVPSYGVFASAKPPAESFLSKILKAFTHDKITKSATLRNVSLTGSGLALVQASEGAQEVLFSVPMTSRTAKRLAREKSILSNMSLNSGYSQVEAMPSPNWAEIGAGIVKKETTVQDLDSSCEISDVTVLDWLNQFHYASARRGQSYISDIVEAIHGIPSFEMKEDYLKLLSRVSQSETLTGRIHGDFHSGNILIKNGKVWRVVDWDLSREHAPLAWDWLTYLVARNISSSDSWQMALERAGMEIEAGQKPDSGGYLMRFRKADVDIAVGSFPAVVIWQKMEFGDRRIGPMLKSVPWVLRKCSKLLE